MSIVPVPIEIFVATVGNHETFKALVQKLDTYKCFVTNGGERERGIENNGNANANARPRHNNGRKGGGGHGGHGTHGGGGHGHRQAQAPPPRMRAERPRIGVRELSREDMCKKEFLSLTNKVSPQNKDAIVKKMLTGLAPQFSTMYCTVIWTIMQRPVQIYQHIYAEFARIVAMNTPAPNKQIFKGAWEACWRDVTEGTDAFVHVPGSFSDVADEGVFHEWSIWKKCRINLARGCVYLCIHGVFTQPSHSIFEPVMMAVEMALEGKAPMGAPHILDYWLDILSMSWEAQSEVQQALPKATLQKLTLWAQHTGNLPPKCRFKVESLRETYCSASTASAPSAPSSK